MGKFSSPLKVFKKLIKELIKKPIRKVVKHPVVKKIISNFTCSASVVHVPAKLIDL